MIGMVISGAQTGVDRAGLDAAKACGIKTGGLMPRDFRAQDGCHPEFAKLYGVGQSVSSAYPPRTEWNVVNSDLTLILARHTWSPGEVLTRKLLIKHQKPRWDVRDDSFDLEFDHVAGWLQCQFEVKKRPLVVNVAGNSEKTAPGIYQAAYEFLVKLFSKVNK
jgi:hypothetical protein